MRRKALLKGADLEREGAALRSNEVIQVHEHYGAAAAPYL
jgi:hypothetical protein